MRHDGCRGGPAGAWPLGRVSLRVRLLAVALCLLAAGAAVIIGASGLAARGFVMGQADRQVRAYAGRLMSRPFVATPITRLVPGAFSAGGLGGDALGIEVRGSGGRLVLRQGGGARPGHVLPAGFAGATARAGQPVTVAAAGGDSWRVITEPVHYRARRIPFGYDAEDFSVRVTSTARPGRAGTLVVGMDMGGSGATGGLAAAGLVVSGAMVLLIACLGAVLLGAALRPLARARQTLAAVAAGELSRRAPGRGTRGDAGRLARSLNMMLSQIEDALGAPARSEAAARGASERMCRVIADTAHALRRPVSVIQGLAGSCHRRGRPGPGELDQVMRRVAGEAERMDALIDDLPR